MPELPEVHTIASDLRKNLLGCKIDAVEIAHGYKVNPNNQIYAGLLTGSQIDKVGRIGKNLVIKLNNDNFLTFHLAMTGRILLQEPNSPKQPHQKVELTLSAVTPPHPQRPARDGSRARAHPLQSAAGESTLVLRFCDPRAFGKTGVLNAIEVTKLKQKYGPDLVAQEITAEVFLSRLQSKNTAIKNALMEQSVVAGLGNIYATDALWTAKIHPETKTRALTLKQAQNLLESAKDVLIEGIKHRGSTLPDEAYVDAFGRSGNHQKYLRIYGKSACPKCKTKVEYKKINGRGAYFCPTCQK